MALSPIAAAGARLKPGPAARHRLDVLVRLLAGAGGGYGLAALFAMLLSVALPLARLEAVLFATMGSFAVYAAAVVWAFAARSALRACLGLAVPAALLGLALWGMGA